MLHCLATRANYHLLREFLDSWSPSDHDRLRAVAYERFPFSTSLANGVCVFADLERLSPWELEQAGRLAARLHLLPQNYSVLNDPSDYVGRFRLLELLHEHGINLFRGFRVDDLDQELRFPVFIRNEQDHEGPMTPLLESRRELHQVLAQKRFQNPSLRKHLMVVEYCDCKDADGIFRKYSVMNVGGTLIPRHVLLSNNWSTKKPDIVNEQTLAEESVFIANFPHEETIRNIFKIAGLSYGRIDYGLCRGRIQVWEINTNPTIVPPRARIDARRLPLQSHSARLIVEAMRTLADRHPVGSAKPFLISELLPAWLAGLARSVINKRRY